MSDIKPVLTRVEEAPEEWLALAACVRDLAEAARTALPATRETGERRRCWTCQHYHTYREVGDLPSRCSKQRRRRSRLRRSWAACDNSECRCSTLVENPAGFIAAVLSKYGLSEGSEG